MSQDAQKIARDAAKAGAQEEKKPVLIEKGELGELAKTALLAIAIALIIRTVLFEPFNIPSSSMKPTLLVGDYLFVNKPAYGYSRFSFPFGVAPISGRVWGKEPKRGDVVVFALPTQTMTNFIKRVIGLPGDKIQVKQGRLYINDQMVQREYVGPRDDIDDIGKKEKLIQYIETLPEGVIHSIYERGDDQNLDDTPEYIVPEDHYFMMGDNRDNSQDSRVQDKVGFVPFENIVGRADFLFFSTNGFAAIYEFWKWPWTIRFGRLFMDIDPVAPGAAKQSAVEETSQTDDGSRG